MATRNLLTGILTLAVVAAIGRADFGPVDFSSFHNTRMQDGFGSSSHYPEGDLLLGGVPFSIPAGGNNAWAARG
jgi:hypothetical protein